MAGWMACQSVAGTKVHELFDWKHANSYEIEVYREKRICGEGDTKAEALKNLEGGKNYEFRKVTSASEVEYAATTGPVDWLRGLIEGIKSIF